MATYNTTKNPVVVIKKGSLIKPKHTPIVLKTLMKRPNNASLEDNSSAKRLCPEIEFIKEDTADSIDDVSASDSQLQETNEVRMNAIPKGQKSIKPKKSTCFKKHNPPLLEHEAEGLVQPGDVFPSIDEFNKYIRENAKKWYFFYVRSESRLNSHHGTCVYRCRFFRKKQKSQSTGKRSQKSKQPLSLSCPASLHLKRIPGSEVMKVNLVCHHHTHELTKEVFDQQPHGYRLAQPIKDDIHDLALLNVHPSLIRKYVESKEPDINLGKTVINTVIKIRNEGITKETMTPERMSEMMEKIRCIKNNFDLSLTTGSKHVTPKKQITYKKTPARTYKRGTKTKTTPKSISKKGLGSNARSDEIVMEQYCTNDEGTNTWDMQLCDVEGGHDEIYSDTVDEKFNTTYTSDVEELESTYEQNDYESFLLNPTTGAFEAVVTEDVDCDKKVMLINPTTGMLDELTESESSGHNINIKKQYKIGNISIECVESIDETGMATFTLENIKSRGPLTKSTLLSQLSKTEQSVNEPVEYSPKIFEIKEKETKKAKAEKTVKDPVVESIAKCMVRHEEMAEQQTEGLIQAGSTFSSIEELLRYAAANASKWFFYYHVFDSRNTKTSVKYNSKKAILYNLNCRFNKGFYKSKSKGLRKVKTNNIFCPATLAVKCLPHEDKFTVVYACHHHSHELSAELFGKEAHGHRLPKELKEEIRLLAWCKLDTRLIKQHVEDITGLDVAKTVKNIVAEVKKKKITVDVPPEKMRELLEKIKVIKHRYQIPKRVFTKRKSTGREVTEDTSDSEEEEVEQNKSRVETRLNNILYDQELIKSVKELQENTGCEIEINPWGGVDVIRNSAASQQEGVVVSEYKRNQDNDTEKTECRIKIDQEVYNMEEDVQYIIPSDQVLTIGEGEQVVYIQQDEAETIISDANNTMECNETVIYEDESEVANEIECGDSQEDQSTQMEIQKTEPDDQTDEEYHQAAFDYTDDDNEYKMMYQYTNGEEHENDESKHYAQNYNRKSNNEIYECRDAGVQADLELIQLEKDHDKISELESAVVHQDIGRSKYSYNSRSQPKYIIQEAIINRFNIEFYLSQCGVTTCLENLAANMGLSVLSLLKQLYQGQAVFKMTIGRSGRQNRKTVHLAHIPLTIAFPFEKYKYINSLQEYKMLCSKYSDVTIKLEDTVQSISKALEAKTLELENLHKSQELVKIETHDNLLRNVVLLDKLLKQKENDLATANNQNEILRKKVQHLEGLVITSRIKDAEILKQLLEPTIEQQEKNELIKENKTLQNRIKELNGKCQNDIMLAEHVNSLENALAKANTDNNNYKTKIRKIEQLYLTDNDYLLGRIASLETELEKYKKSSSAHNSTASLRITESKSRNLQKQVNDSKTGRLFDDVKIKKLSSPNLKLGKQLNETRRVYGTRSKQKND